MMAKKEVHVQEMVGASDEVEVVQGPDEAHWGDGAYSERLGYDVAEARAASSSEEEQPEDLMGPDPDHWSPEARAQRTGEQQ